MNQFSPADLSPDRELMSEPIRSTYDFIVCGGGTTGSVVTRRLAEVQTSRSCCLKRAVLACQAFDDASLDKVAAEANDTDFGLAASIWTRDISTAHKLAKKVKAGSVWINQHNFYDPALPFGGYKQSGWGREQGSEALRTFTEVKAVCAAL